MPSSLSARGWNGAEPLVDRRRVDARQDALCVAAKRPQSLGRQEVDNQRPDMRDVAGSGRGECLRNPQKLSWLGKVAELRR